jgi:hypothetical protein
LRALLHRYPLCDQSVNHAAVVFYGARDCPFHLTGRTLPLDVLETQLLQPFAAFLENERQQREAARLARLADYGSREQPAREQATRYVVALYEKRFAELAATEPGSGLRHRRLYTAAITIGSLQSAAWLPAPARTRLDGAAHDLLLAAETNGYVADYGEDDAWRTISNGLAQGMLRPREEPVWYAERPFFQVGDPVKAIVRGEVKAVGLVRETTHWEYELDTLPDVWFARPLLTLVGVETAG